MNMAAGSPGRELVPAEAVLRLILGGVLLIVGCGKTPSTEVTVNHKPRTDLQAMTEDLHQFHEMVTEGWAYLEAKQELQGVDISGTRDRLLNGLTADTTPQQFAEMLQEFAASLEDGHAEVDVRTLKEPPARTWPVGFGIVREGLIVANLNYLPENPGIELGDRLVQVNGEPIEDLVAEKMQVSSASTDASRRVLAVDRLHWTDDETVEFLLEHPDGSLLRVTLPCLAGYVNYRFRERTACCEHSELDAGIHLIRIPLFTWNEAAFESASTDGERESALLEAKSQVDAVFAAADDAQGLILDLRGNPGGYDLLSSYVAEHLVPGDFVYFLGTRRDSEFIRSLSTFAGLPADRFGVQHPHRPRAYAAFRHFTGTVYSGRLVVLINARSFSTTDNLCAFLRDSRPETRFVGEPTGGGTGEPATVGRLNHSQVPIRFCVMVVHSPRGRLIEGVGTTPDVVIEPTRDALLEGRDPALEAAIGQFAEWQRTLVAKPQARDRESLR